MKQRRFSEPQISAILKGVEAGIRITSSSVRTILVDFIPSAITKAGTPRPGVSTSCLVIGGLHNGLKNFRDKEYSEASSTSSRQA
jgi:hypothetical protein